jgi:hypothetical protein
MRTFRSTWIGRDDLWATRLVLLAVGLLGVAHVAYLPPFEGVDELGHWSYVQELTDTGHLPRLGTSKLSADVESYPGPIAEWSEGTVYRLFFAGGAADLNQPVARSFHDGHIENGEAQHPPLYYLVLAPFYLLAKDWSWPNHLLLLRLVSWSLAFAGFAVGCLASQRALADVGGEPGTELLIAAWPLLFPQFFPEMARLGNDALCLLLMAVAWHFLLRGLHRPDWRAATGLGIALGLGLLTKAFFWPIGAGMSAFLLFAAWRERDLRYLKLLASAAALAILIGGWWYIRNLIMGSSFFNARDFLLAGQAGSLWHRLGSGNAADELAFILREVAVIAGSFTWAGTRTLGMLPRIFTAPVFLVAALPLGLWLLRLKRLPVAGAAPLFLAAPLIAGLLYHAIDQALPGGVQMGTPGWYLHILAAPLSLALALGWRWNWLFRSLAIYAIGFHVVCWVTQLSVFSGCAYRTGAHASLRLDPGSCLIVPGHLAVLGEPWLGGVTFAAAVAAGMAALAFANRAGKPAGPSAASLGNPTRSPLAGERG